MEAAFKRLDVQCYKHTQRDVAKTLLRLRQELTENKRHGPAYVEFDLGGTSIMLEGPKDRNAEGQEKAHHRFKKEYVAERTNLVVVDVGTWNELESDA